MEKSLPGIVHNSLNAKINLLFIVFRYIRTPIKLYCTVMNALLFNTEES